ncbi:MAG: hypothetical protein U0169_14810 [Polyangiaceae bacterium]
MNVRVESDPGVPLRGAEIVYAGKTIATTGEAGLAKLRLTGKDGESFDVNVQCPTGFASPSKALTVTLRRLVDPGKTPEFSAECRPTTRTVVVLVRAENGPNLPVLYLNREVARTDASGAAHVLMKMNADEQFDLRIGTTEKGSEGLRPQNPVATFRVAQRDEVFVFDARFAVDAPKVHGPAPRGPTPVGPIRLAPRR